VRDSLARAALAGLLALAAVPAGGAESKSGVRLLGTIVSSNPSSSQAVVLEGDKQRVVRVGMDVDGAEVVEIHADEVVLRRRAQVETLTLASYSVPPGASGHGDLPAAPAPSGYDGDPSSAAPAARAAAAPRRSASRAALALRRGARSSPARDSKESSEKEVARSNDELLAQLAMQARFAPVMDNDGKLRGVAVMNVMSDSAIERLGLQSDDVIVAIQGTPIDSSGRAMNVARGLRFTQPVKLDIERRGQPTVVMVQPGSLKRP